MADHIKPMLQLPNPNHHSLQEGLLLYQTTMVHLVVLAVVKLPLLHKDKVVVKVV